MKIIKEEFCHSYKTYSFGYKILLDREEKDVLSEIYALGFLPYSGSFEHQDRFYLARSARISLCNFAFSSENRRVWKKFENIFTVTIQPAYLMLEDTFFMDFCLKYFQQRHGENIMASERLRHILERKLNTSVAIYTDSSNKIVAYVIENKDKEMGHFWFSFYDLSYAYQSLGMWIMLERIKNAKDLGQIYYYLGTVYGDKALYKTNFPLLEFWDGTTWVQNTPLLKSLARNDNSKIFD